MTQLTEKDKTVVFAMYLGSDYSYHNGDVIEKVSGLTISAIEDNDHLGNPQLILSDLSDITDEDAQEVISIIWRTSNFHRPTNGQYIAQHLPYADLPAQTAIEIGDFLRSKSYALPYKSVNLFDAGIAVKGERK